VVPLLRSWGDIYLWFESYKHGAPIGAGEIDGYRLIAINVALVPELGRYIFMVWNYKHGAPIGAGEIDGYRLIAINVVLLSELGKKLRIALLSLRTSMSALLLYYGRVT